MAHVKRVEFEATWEAADGYVGKSRPQYVTFHGGMLDPDMTEQELRNLFNETIEEDFEQTVSWSSEDEDEFVKWAQERIEAMKEEKPCCVLCGVVDCLEEVSGKGLMCDDCREGNVF